MEPDTVIDVKPNGDIQSRLAALNVDTMRKAVNNDDPKAPLVFPTGTSDADFQAAIDGINSVINIADPGFQTQNVPLGAIDHSHVSRRHIHPRTKSTVAVARKRTEPSLGKIRGKATHGVRLDFLPHLKVTHFNATEGSKHLEDIVAGFPFLDFTWGDLWEGVKQGWQTIKSVVLTPIVDGINAAIQVVKDGLTYAWNGLVSIIVLTIRTHLINSPFSGQHCAESLRCHHQRLRSYRSRIRKHFRMVSNALGLDEH
jgi:hypothetical protein